MSNTIRPSSFQRIVIGATTLAALLLVVPTGAGAGGFLSPGTQNAGEAPPKPEYAVPAKRMEVSGEGTDAIVAQLKNAQMRVHESRQNAETAEYDLQRARTRRYPRGEALEKLRIQVVDMGSERVAAEQEFTALVEEARRAGVPMGTLAPYMDFADQIRAGQTGK